MGVPVEGSRVPAASVDVGGRSTSPAVLLPPGLGWMVGLWPAWVALMAVAFVAGQLAQRPGLLVTCGADETCLSYQLDDATADTLAERGIDLTAYASIVVGAAIASFAGLLVLAFLVRSRAQRELLPIAASWALPAMGATFYVRESIASDVGWLMPLVVVAFVVNFASLGLLLACFPNGHWVPRWIRWVALVWVLTTLADVLDAVSSAYGDSMLPRLLYDAVTVFTPVSLLLLLGAQVYRYRRRSGPVERRQTRWVLAGLGGAVTVTVAIIAASYISGSSPGESGDFGFILLEATSGIAALVVFAALAVALVRFRLWGVELVINRLLVWGTLTVGVLVLYVSVVAVSSGLLGVDNSGAAAVAVAVAVALGLQPARRRLQRLADRAVWGRRDEPDEIASDMRDAEADLTEPDAVLTQLANLIAVNLKLPAARLTVTLPDGTVAEGQHGVPDAARTESTALHVGGAAVGELACEPRPGQRRLSDQDRRALAALAQQASVTAGMLRLAHEREQLRRRLVDARDHERKRLRRDLHDGLGPTLASVAQRIGAARSSTALSARSDSLLADAIEGLHHAIAELRRIVLALRPPSLDQYGLIGALRRSAERAGNSDIVIDGDDVIRPISPDYELAMYRVAEEAIFNAQRHSSATDIHLTLRDDARALLLEVSDNGTGMPTEPTLGVGIRSMHERLAAVGGSLEIDARAGGGTVVRARIPWDANP